MKKETSTSINKLVEMVFDMGRDLGFQEGLEIGEQRGRARAVREVKDIVQGKMKSAKAEEG